MKGITKRSCLICGKNLPRKHSGINHYCLCNNHRAVTFAYMRHYKIKFETAIRVQRLGLRFPTKQQYRSELHKIFLDKSGLNRRVGMIKKGWFQ